MELILGYEILESYKRLPYKTWFALAEFIDNSTQSYRNNVEKLNKWYEEDGEALTVEVTYKNSKKDGFIKVKDNAYGMNLEDLQNAMTLGKKPLISNERSKYGLGLKTAAFWFGNKWIIETTQKGSTELLIITVDLEEILEKEQNYYVDLKKNHPDKPIQQFRPKLNIAHSECASEEHGTVLTISDHVRSINSTDAKKCIEYLQSIYRIDLKNNILNLEFQEKPLCWLQEDIDKKLLLDSEGNKFKRDIEFEINGKKVSGWAGILASGSKALGGFSLIQAERVIVGYPKNYRNSLIFGSEDGGRNDLTNQRLMGELNLDERFGVSHTKDQILFVEDEEDDLDEALFKKLADFKKESNIPYKNRDKELEETFDFDSAIETVIKNLNSPTFRDSVLNKTILPKEAIIKTNEETIDRLAKSKFRSFEYKLGEVSIIVILSEDSSPWDPYLIVKSLSDISIVKVVINVNHPYWIELPDNNSRFNFLLSCIYDGVAEWKAGFLTNSLDPDTIKYIKDSLLRLELKLY